MRVRSVNSPRWAEKDGAAHLSDSLPHRLVLWLAPLARSSPGAILSTRMAPAESDYYPRGSATGKMAQSPLTRLSVLPGAGSCSSAQAGRS
jgi:hypothetical protein